MIRSRKLLGMIAAAAGVYLTATTAIAEPLLTKSGRPACGNVKTKAGNKIGSLAMRVARRDDLQKQLEASLADPNRVAALQAGIDHEEECIADIEARVAAAQAAQPAPAPPAPAKAITVRPKAQASRAVVRR